MNAHPDGDRPKRPDARRIWRVILQWVAVFAALSVGWLATQGILRLTGHPPRLVEYLLAIAVTIVLAAIVVGTVSKITGRGPTDRQDVAADVVAALDRLSHGDFDVRLTTNDHEPFAELIRSLNQTASQLGDLEQQRQDFISNVSHEIQSPLTSISGFAELLRRDDLDAATRRHYLDIILAETKRVSTLGDNLLRLSALEADDALDKHPYRLDEQLRSVILAAEPQWSDKGLDVTFDGAPVTIEADAGMLRQVWINLIQNAVKYSKPEGGRIEVKESRDGGQVRVDIADDGIGIAPNDLPHVFERFFRADRSRSGSGNGLGLSLARRIVELHGGTLTVVSELGRGSTFTVTLSEFTSR